MELIVRKDPQALVENPFEVILENLFGVDLSVIMVHTTYRSRTINLNFFLGKALKRNDRSHGRSGGHCYCSPGAHIEAQKDSKVFW